MKLNKFIDHTLLKADAKSADIEKLCREARQYDFASCCVNPVHVKLVHHLLEGSSVMTCTVIGFPLGASATEIKAEETRHAILDGVDEIDMVINVGAVKEGNRDFVTKDIKAVVNAAAGKTVKVIIEACLLTDEEKKLACECSLAAGAHFVKTSTGFSHGGATIADVKLMKAVVGNMAEVKASGGVKTLEQMKEFIAAGATRIGTSSGIALVQGEEVKGGY